MLCTSEIDRNDCWRDEAGFWSTINARIAATPDWMSGEDLERDLLAKWPHLATVAPGQPGTLREQLALATTPRPTPPQFKVEHIASIIEHNPDVFKPLLMELLARSIGELVGEFVSERGAAA
jgi:hypothetical protein